MLPTPVFLPGEFHGQRSLTGYSPWGHKELEVIECLSTHRHNQGQSFPQSHEQLMVKCGTGLAPKLREGTSLLSGAAQTHSFNEGLWGGAGG